MRDCYKDLVANSGEPLLSFETQTGRRVSKAPKVNCSFGMHPKLHATAVSI